MSLEKGLESARRLLMTSMCRGFPDSKNLKEKTFFLSPFILRHLPDPFSSTREGRGKNSLSRRWKQILPGEKVQYTAKVASLKAEYNAKMKQIKQEYDDGLSVLDSEFEDDMSCHLPYLRAVPRI
jgi:hypothetical protein